MPQPKITRTAQKNGAPQGDTTLEEAAVIRSAIGAKEQAPSTRVNSVFQNWRDVADVLGDPFETERIALSKLRQMRRDSMLGFGLSFIKTPHVRAKWYMNAKSTKGPNAQVASHADHDMRRIYASFVLQWLNSLDFGFQGIGKRFEYRTPAGSYIETNPDSGEQEEKPIWSEGSVQPIAFKPFVALRPEGIEPVWNNLGEFDGIEYSPTGQGGSGGGGGSGVPSGVGAGKTSGGKGGSDQQETYKIDLAHSLWVTNEKAANFDSIFGYPRLGYAYKYWWSYWFRWAIADRAFERKADPSVIIYHPEGEFLDEGTGQRLSYSDFALLMGERMRSGGVIALPSETYEDNNGRGTLRQWEIDFTKEATNFDPFDKSFEYLDIQKLRSLFIPEQAFLEGKGGTSSRNVAAEMGQSFVESQAVLSAQIVETINRFILPQWLAANYPEFMADGGSVEIIIQGFGDEDTDFMLQLVQLVGQQESGMREIMKLADMKKILQDRGTPIVSFAEQQRREAALVAEQQALNAPQGAVPGIPGQQVGVVPTGTGFAYIQPREIIHLSDSGTDFIENLPGSPHYSDKAIRGFSRQIWTLFRDLYRDEYNAFANHLEDLPEAIELADSPMDVVKKIWEGFSGSDKWGNLADRYIGIMRSVLKRSARLEAARAKAKASLSDEEIDAFLVGHVGTIVQQIADTNRYEIHAFLANKIEEGVTDKTLLAKSVREHFSDFPQWKADRVARTEIRDIYNAGTLLAAQSAGIDRVQAVDGVMSADSDDECKKRHGKIFSVKDALKEKEHPNGTLGWRMVPATLTIERRDEGEDFSGATWDDQENLLTLSNALDTEAQNKILLSVMDELVP